MTKPSDRLASGRVALVTGASGGIGRAAAETLAKAGYRVFGTTRRAAPGEAADGVEFLTCDVTSDASVREAVAAVEAAAGRIDLLVNNAGVGLLGAAEESSIEQVHAIFDTNLYGTIRMTNAVLPLMRRRRSGRIVNLSSIMGVIPAPFSAHYAAAKHAVEGYSESLDHEVRNLGIRVVLVEPGMTRSSFERSAGRPETSIADYDTGRSGVLGWFSEGMKAADAPEVVAGTILLAATTPTPRPRYTSGKGIGRIALLRRLVPPSALDRTLRRQMHLP